MDEKQIAKLEYWPPRILDGVLEFDFPFLYKTEEAYNPSRQELQIFEGN
jgi:hypothetical protein